MASVEVPMNKNIAIDRAARDAERLIHKINMQRVAVAAEQWR